MDYQESIKKRIVELKEQRDTFVQQANLQVAMLNGAIGELERLLKDGATDGNSEARSNGKHAESKR